MLGGFLALLSAATFGLNNASIRRGVLTGSPTQGMAISVPIGVPLFLLSALAVGSLGALAEFSTVSLLLLACAGIIHFVWGRYWNYNALQAMGSNLVGPIQQAGLIVTLVGAVWLLDEKLTPLRVIGIALIVLGPFVMLRSRPPSGLQPTSVPRTVGAAVTANAAFQPDYVKGIGCALLSVIGFGSSALFIRGALSGTTPGTAIAGGLVSYLSASVVFAIYVLGTGKLRHVIAIEHGAVRWFTLSGVMVCASQMFRFMALSIAPVAVVAPLQQMSAVFRVIFSWFINREHEDFSRWVLAGIAVSLSGALALTLSVDFVMETLPLPASLIEFSRWQWP